MGRKYPNLKDRLYTAYNLIRYGKGKIRCMSCGKCGSIIIKSISEKPAEIEWIDEKHQVDQMWIDLVRCRKCGAVCKEIQMWNFDGDVYKVDPYIDADKTEK